MSGTIEISKASQIVELLATASPEDLQHAATLLKCQHPMDKDKVKENLFRPVFGRVLEEYEEKFDEHEKHSDKIEVENQELEQKVEKLEAEIDELKKVENETLLKIADRIVETVEFKLGSE